MHNADMAAPQTDITGRALASQLLQTAESATLAAEAATTATKEVQVAPESQNQPGALSARPVKQARP